MIGRGLVLYLHVHQPWRVRDYSVFDMAIDHEYFKDGTNPLASNRAIIEKVADKSYRPMNAVLERLLTKYPDFQFSLSISGTLIEQLEAWAPDVIASFQRLVATGRVEIVAETYYHSLAFFYSRPEFERQVQLHQDTIDRLFGVRSTAFRNTELAYNDHLAKWADDAGFEAIITEGWDKVLGWRSPNYVYRPHDTNQIKLLLKNYRLSDDIAFRFSNRDWEGWPLTAEKFTTWVNDSLGEGQIVNLFMDYETFGENIWKDAGIFEFFETFVGQWGQNEHNTFYTITGAAREFGARDSVSMPDTVTWADTERDLTAWLGNSMQQEAMRHLYALEDEILRSSDSVLLSDWRRLTTSDHPYYMCTKWSNDGDVHAYFSPYSSPYDAFLYFMNAVRDVRWRTIVADRSRGGSNG